MLRIGLRIPLRIGCLLGLALTPCSNGWSTWVSTTTPVPVERLLNNVTKYIKEHPQDAQGYYVLGRLHSMSFAKGTESLEVVPEKNQEGRDNSSLPGFAPSQSILIGRPAESKINEEARNHLKKSIRNYRKATDLDSRQALPFLGLGWVLEQGSQWALELGAPPGEEPTAETPTQEREHFSALVRHLGAAIIEERQRAFNELKSELEEALPILLETRRSKAPFILAGVERLLSFYWKERALAAYRQAYTLALSHDLEKKQSGPEADSAVSLEAGQGIVRILKSRGPSQDEQREIDLLQKSIAALKNRPRAITPIIFPLTIGNVLEDLLANGRFVSFDLDGRGEPSLWPWVHSATGILVWDPEESGRIESGLQLFGSVTWWMFWKDGYQPLAALDDDGDGWLSGAELQGIGVWRDGNGNGISESGEVVPAQSFEITRVAVRASRVEAGVPFNPRGIYLSDGTALPTYDWIPVPVGWRNQK
jgi:hypothetical protein